MLIDYLPRFVSEYKEIKKIMSSEQQEIDSLRIEINRMFNNQFIMNCDVKGITRFEKLLGIIPNKFDTLESRKSRVLVRWNDSIPYTLKELKEKLLVMCGEGNFDVELDEYNLIITVKLPLINQVNELEYMLNYMIPCNLIVTTRNNLEYKASAVFYASPFNAINRIYNIKSELNKHYLASGTVFDGYNSNKEIIYEIN